jgi:hypothetical protein
LRVARELGTDVFALLATIVHAEDATGYQKPIAYFNDDLAELCGLSLATMKRARERAVEAGWLIYETGAKGRAARYYVQIPAWVGEFGESQGEEFSGHIPAHSEPLFGVSGRIPAQPEPECEPHSSLLPSSQYIPASAGESAKAPPKQKKPRTNPADDPLFARFWAAYPKRVSKADAVNAFTKARTAGHITDTNFDAILAAVERQCRSPDWLKNDGQYVPYPASWLNARRWEDELAISALPAEPPRIKRAADNPLVDDDYDYAPHGVTA